MCELARSRLSRTTVDWFVDSPLSLVADRYVQYLIERGYTPGTTSVYLECVAHLSHWMILRRVELARLDEDLVHRFLERHLPACHCARRCQRVRHTVRAALGHLLELLRREGRIAPRQSTDPPAVADELDRFERYLVGFLPQEQVQAILSAPPETTWSGQRDRVMLATLYNTGARVSELTGMRVCDVMLASTAAVRIHGKGRKERTVPLWRNTATQIRRWLRAYPRGSEQPVFPNRRGERMTRVGVTERLYLAVRSAAAQYPELGRRRVSPHLLRHSLAMRLLQSGVDITVIALWLGHESPVTTHMYVEADLAMKERALKMLQTVKTKQIRYQPKDRVLAFLQSL